MKKIPTIRGREDIARGVCALTATCAVMRGIHERYGDPPLRLHKAGFEGLARIVVGQQLSIASAEAIWRRVAAAVAPLDAETLLQLEDEALRGAGLSRPKIRTLRALATAIAHGGLDLARLSRAEDHAVHAQMTAISGIGPWTADIYLMFCLGRADAWASGDLALQIATRTAMGLEERPKASELVEIAERWRPWRGVAARMLWHSYKGAREERA